MRDEGEAREESSFSPRPGSNMVTMSNLLRRCHECNQPLGKKDIFCPRCGAKQPRKVATSNDEVTDAPTLA